MEQAKQLLGSYLKVTRNMSKQFRNYFGQLDLTFPQALVLTILGEVGAIPLNRLAQYTGNANSTVSGIIDRLEKMKLVQRVRSEEDRRVIYVELTKEYRAKQKTMEPNVSAYLGKMLETMSPEEIADIIAALDRLNAVLEQPQE